MVVVVAVVAVVAAVAVVAVVAGVVLVLVGVVVVVVAEWGGVGWGGAGWGCLPCARGGGRTARAGGTAPAVGVPVNERHGTARPGGPGWGAGPHRQSQGVVGTGPGGALARSG